MEVFWTEVTLGEGGFQRLPIGEVRLNVEGDPETAFFVGLAGLTARNYSLGIDRSSPDRGASFVSEDGGASFLPIGAIPILAGNAMIRAHEKRLLPLDRPIGKRIVRPREAAPEDPWIWIDSSHDGARDPGRDTLINDRVNATSGSDGCPGCWPALVPGYPKFTLATPDRYEDYITIENTSATGIAMPFRTTLTSLTPVSVEAVNTDDGGGRPPTGTWVWGLSYCDATDSLDDVLDPGERVTRLWEIADEGGDYLTKLLLHCDGDGSFGHIEGHAVFDGSDNEALIADHEELDIAGDLTLTGWVRLAGHQGGTYHKGIIGSWSFPAGRRSYLLMVRNADNAGFILSTLGYQYSKVINGTTDLDDGEWHHLVGVRSGTTMRLYVDGAEEGTTSLSGSLYDNDVDSHPVRIGSQFGVAGTFFDGLIDDVAVYDRAWSPAEVDQTYLRGLQRLPLNVTGGRIGYWPLDHDFLDYTGNGHDGIPEGDVYTTSGGKIFESRGDPALDAASRKFGAGSMHFDGDVDYLNVPVHEDWGFGTEDFTIDFWMITPADANNRDVLLKIGVDHSPWNASIEITIGPDVASEWFAGGNKIGVHLNYNGASWGAQFAGITKVADGAWHHVAVVRSGNNVRLFVDGSLDGSTSYSFSYPSYEIAIAGQSLNDRGFSGHLDELRVSKGIARWSAGFTPPAEPYTPDIHSSLLLHLDGDESASTHTATLRGNPQSDGGGGRWQGSLALDGSGDYLDFSDHADWDLGDGDFTVDAWIRPAALAGYNSFVGNWSSIGNLGWDFRASSVDLGNRFMFIYSTDGSGWTLVDSGFTLTLDTWQHVAVSRSGGTLYLFVDGDLKTTFAIGSASIFDAGAPLYVGYCPAGSTYYNGGIDELRLSKGIARWTANFTPPQVPYD